MVRARETGDPRILAIVPTLDVASCSDLNFYSGQTSSPPSRLRLRLRALGCWPQKWPFAPFSVFRWKQKLRAAGLGRGPRKTWDGVLTRQTAKDATLLQRLEGYGIRLLDLTPSMHAPEVRAQMSCSASTTEAAESDHMPVACCAFLPGFRCIFHTAHADEAGVNFRHSAVRKKVEAG